jgi:hypothetical protein
MPQRERVEPVPLPVVSCPVCSGRADVYMSAGAVVVVRDHGWAAAGDGSCGNGGPLT